MPNRGCLPILALLACLAAAAHAATGDAPAGTDSAQPAPAPQSPANMIDTGRKLDALAAELASLDTDLPDTASAVRARAELDEIEPELRRYLASLPAATAAGASLITRDGLDQALARIDTELAATRRPLDRRVTKLESHREALVAGTDLVAAILATDREDVDLPEAVLQRATMLAAGLDSARSRLRAALDVAVTDTQRAATMQQQANEGHQAIEAARRAENEAALTLGQQQRPLWKTPPRLGEIVPTIATNLASARVMFLDSWQANAGRWWLLFAGLPLLIGGMVALRRAAGPATPGETQALVLQHPTAASVLLWAVLGPELVGIGYTSSYGLLRIVIIVAAAWPMLPIIAPASVQLLLRGLLFLAAVAIWLAALLGAQAGAAGFVLIGVLGLVLFIRLRSATATVREPAPSGLRGILRFGISAGIVLLAVGVIAAVFGNLRLGQQLIEGVLVSTLLPVVLFVAAQTLRELWDQALERGPARNLRAARTHPELLRRRGHQLINFALVLLVLPLLPRLFPFTSLLWSALDQILRARLEVGGISLSLLNIVALFVAVTVAIVLARFVRFALDEEIMARLPMTTGAASAASRLVYYLLLVIGLLMALAAAGFELGQLTLVVSALGVGLGFGLQNIVSNFVSGIVLAFERPFQIGDVIEVGQQSGRVLSIGLRATNVRTPDGAEVIVPNSTFISGNVINWTLSDRMRRIELTLGVAYGSDLRRVQAIIQQVIDRMPDLARSPEPLVVFTSFGESALNFRVLVWTPDGDRTLVTTSELALAINDAFQEAGIEIPFPQRDIHIRTQVQGV